MTELFATIGSFGINVVLRSSILLLLTFGIATVWRNASSAQRHLVWAGGIAAAVAIPVLHLALPSWNLFILPVELTPQPLMASSAMLGVTGAGTPIHLSETATAAQAMHHPWIFVGLFVWCIGAVIGAAHLWRSHRSVRKTIQNSVDTTDPRVVRIAEYVCHHLRVTQPVTILQTTTPIPFVYGFRNPAIILPHDAGTWSDDRLQDVLIHEMAHIQRADAVTRGVASAMCVLYWFNPLAWFAARELREQQEHACDDRVLQTGRRASVYATHLLDFASLIHSQSKVSMTIATFANSRHITQRLRAIVDDTRARGGVTARGYLVASFAAVGITLPVAALNSAPAPSPIKHIYMYPTPQVLLEDEHPQVIFKPIPDSTPTASQPVRQVARTDELPKETLARLSSLRTIDSTQPMGQVRPIRRLTPRTPMPLSSLLQLHHPVPDSAPRGIVISENDSATVLVDRPAQILLSGRPAYPKELMSKGIEGVVTLEFIVGTNGRYQEESVRVISSTHELFTQSAIKMLATMTFTPAMKNGKLVQEVMRLPFGFHLNKKEKPDGNP